MSEAKFTKGEWIVLVESGNAKVYYPHGVLTSENVIKVDDSRLDGESWIEMRERTEPEREAAKAESNANMHLIAAAPEMYEMLSSLSEMMPMLDEQTHPQIEMDSVKYDIDSLLAKARGEQ